MLHFCCFHLYEQGRTNWTMAKMFHYSINCPRYFLEFFSCFRCKSRGIVKLSLISILSYLIFDCASGDILFFAHLVTVFYLMLIGHAQQDFCPNNLMMHLISILESWKEISLRLLQAIDIDHGKNIIPLENWLETKYWFRMPNEYVGGHSKWVSLR